jgi:cobalt-zinc-cadmium efflux system outer membrane protein
VRGFSLTVTTIVFGTALALLAPAPAGAQAPPPQPSGASPPMTFRQVLDLATAQNLELAAVRRARAVREADVRAAGQWANPDFSGEITKDVPHGDLTFGLPVDISGRRSNRVAVAKAGLAMADVDEANAMRQLRRDTRLAFYGVLAANEAMALAESVVQVAQRFRDVTQARFDEGAAPRLDVMGADLGLVRAKADLELARSARRAYQADLNALLNRPPGMTIALEGEAFDLPQLPTLDGATATAFSHNIELVTLDREAAIETSTLDLLKAERVPMPTFSFGTALNAPGEFNVGPHAGVSVEIPLFSRNQGEIAGSLARSDTIRARREALRRSVEARVYAAMERVTAQRAQVDAFRKTIVPTATSVQGLAEESYRLGRTSVLEALAAQRALRDTKYDYLQALLALQAAVADLEDILGSSIQ